MTTSGTISEQSTMQQIVAAYPGARRALFRRYHIGGCSSCGFQPTETLEQVAQRNSISDVSEVLDHIRASHEQDEKILLSPKDLERVIREDKSAKLLDVRSREEHEAARIDGSILLSQQLMQDIMSAWPRHGRLVIVDHQGQQALDAAAYFLGHGFENVRCLRGGIDAWSQEVDPNVPRYRIG